LGGYNDISRVTRSKDEARSSYDRMSRWYDLLAGRWERRHASAGLVRLAATEGDRVLEIGPGTGEAILLLARQVGAAGNVFGVDISIGMLRRVLRRAREAGEQGVPKLVCGDGVRLPFREGTLDSVFMSFTLELFDTPEILAVLAECRRIMRVGGRICVVGISKEGGAGWVMKAYGWAHRVLPRFVDCRPIYVEKSLGQAGFEVTDAETGGLFGLPVETVVARAC
jgi:demethylmenaquinone methyltransferase/2-methoxy-6-polyprenyl-1,4-benzoquinol methylase